MPKVIGEPVSFKRDWYAAACYLRFGWAWRWWYGRAQLVARVVASFRDRRDLEQRLLQAEEQDPVMPRLPNEDGAPPIPHGEMGSWETLYPNLASYMVDPVWPGGQTRKPAMLFVMMRDGQWQITLKEPSRDMIVRASVTYPDEMLPALEALLRLERVPWMVDPFAREKGGKKLR